MVWSEIGKQVKIGYGNSAAEGISGLSVNINWILGVSADKSQME